MAKGDDIGGRRASVGKALVVLLVLLVVAGTVARLWLIALAEPRHMAMAPAVFDGDDLLVWRVGAPSVGDVVLFERPDGAGQGLCRVIGAGPTKIDLAPGGMPARVGDVAIERTPADPITGTTTDAASASLGGRESMIEKLPGGRTFRVLLPERGGKGKTYFPRVEDVPAGAYYLLNDNRGAPEPDSRTFGVVAREQIIGVAVRFVGAGPHGTDFHRPRFFDRVP